MKISYIINTACLDPWVNERGNPWRSAGYNRRHSLLVDKVLPATLSQGFHEVIVAGTFETGWGDYKYVPVAPRHRDRRDALWQREIGARHATGNILVFGHDDHAVAPDFVAMLLDKFIVPEGDPGGAWDLLIPRRTHGITGAVLNNGRGGSYMGSHVLVMKRWLWAEVPWTKVDTSYWDTSMTREWKQAGGKLVYTDALTHIDVEASANET